MSRIKMNRDYTLEVDNITFEILEKDKINSIIDVLEYWYYKKEKGYKLHIAYNTTDNFINLQVYKNKIENEIIFKIKKLS